MIKLNGQISVKRMNGLLNIVPGRTGGMLQAKSFNTNGNYIPDENYDGFSEVLVNVFIDFDNLPTVESINNPPAGSPIAVMYDGEIYLLCEGELKNG